ncbi:chromate efflux transporter [Balneatrix alpica]|uniref:Chromate efflux transporter n=1 Tax=Balneatrix alpica TaxID=75684 RepID=A0ABV5ZCC1_9GAMM|nr:chromate efflux transporter [Balneatrix alpica]
MTPSPPAHPSLFEAFKFWLKLGLISFGGPAGQIAIMHQELVEKRRWLSERRFLHALNYCMVLPGPEAQQLATYLGWLLHGKRGGIIAGALFVLPSLFLLMLLSWLYLAYGDQPLLAGLFYGIKPAVTAIVVHAAWRIGSRTLHNPWLWSLAIAAFVALFALHLPFPLIIISAGLIGYLGGRLQPAAFQGSAHQQKKQANYGPALIDDHTPPPAHARFSRRNLLLLLSLGILLWCLPMLLLYGLYGWQGTYTQMGWFFTKAALLTFGGAYAVLPYVYQGAVGHYGWLSPSQMIDGLALGETTPGPLIMVVTFVAFVGGSLFNPLGLDWQYGSGLVAALLVTWFTFLPAFLFILIGGPLVESTHGKLSFTAPLTAITAAVVGVIVNLALFFAQHVLWPQGLQQGIWHGLDLAAMAIALLATLALFTFKRGIMEVIATAALIGLLLQL